MFLLSPKPIACILLCSYMFSVVHIETFSVVNTETLSEYCVDEFDCTEP